MTPPLCSPNVQVRRIPLRGPHPEEAYPGLLPGADKLRGLRAFGHPLVLLYYGPLALGAQQQVHAFLRRELERYLFGVAIRREYGCVNALAFHFYHGPGIVEPLPPLPPGSLHGIRARAVVDEP